MPIGALAEWNSRHKHRNKGGASGNMQRNVFMKSSAPFRL